MRGKQPAVESVFLNVPFDAAYERQFVALGRTPRCVLEIPDSGVGRLSRILSMIESCGASMHDLCRQGQPARFNMPFELGLACAFAAKDKRYSFFVLDRKAYRLDIALSDLKGRDHLIHGGTVRGTIARVCDVLRTPGRGPQPDQIFRVHRELLIVANELKKAHAQKTIYQRAAYLELVAAASKLCVAHGILRNSA
ncbi:MAG TPA: hypothetical protein VGI10_24395 [Polyangiaceae bacterium]|jgi:hypothetical protein